MKRYTDTLLSTVTGLSMLGAKVAVNVAGSTMPAPIYAADDESSQQAANPFTASGSFSFFAADGKYDITVTAGGRTVTIDDVEIVDLLDIARRLGAVEDGEPMAPGSLRADLLVAGGAQRIGFDGGRTLYARAKDAGVYCNDVLGFDATGGADSFASIMEGLNAAMDNNLPYVMGGSPYVAAPIILDRPVNWRFGAGNFKPGFLDGQPYLRKAPGINGPAIVIQPGAYATVIENGGLLCDSGNVGDGVLILANTVTLRQFGVQGAGRDNIRIGGYSAAEVAALPPAMRVKCSPAGINANSWSLDHITTSYAGRHGLVLDDCKDGTFTVVDSNTGLANRFISTSNGGHGLYANHSYLGSTFINPLFEANTGWGAYLDAWSSGILLVGGDIEGNAAGELFEARARANRIIGTSVLGTIYDNMHRSGTWQPTVYGSTSPGAATYAQELGHDIRLGRYSINGNVVSFWARVSWTAHSGSGSLYCSLPFPVTASWEANTLGYVPAHAVLDTSVRAGLINQADRSLRVTDPAGGFAPLPAGGTLYVSGSYELTQPVVTL